MNILTCTSRDTVEIMLLGHTVIVKFCSMAEVLKES